MKQLCAHIPPKTDLDGIRRDVETLVSISENNVPFEETERNGDENCTDWRGQEVKCSEMLLDLAREYNVKTAVYEVFELIYAHEESWTEEERTKYLMDNLSILMDHQKRLCEYFEKTKEIGLGLPDRAAMRMGHLLYSLEVVIKRLDKR